MTDQTQAPIPKIIFCPGCNRQHIDRYGAELVPHKEHLCNIPFCSTKWTPHDYDTIGVEKLPGTDDGSVLLSAYADFCAKRDARKPCSVDYKYLESEAFALAVGPLMHRQAAPDCGECPGDGSTCKTAYKPAQDSPADDADAIHRPTLEKVITALKSAHASEYLNSVAIKVVSDLLK